MSCMVNSESSLFTDKSLRKLLQVHFKIGAGGGGGANMFFEEEQLNSRSTRAG